MSALSVASAAGNRMSSAMRVASARSVVMAASFSHVIHRDRRRASSFGDDPARYDRARPSYPAELVDELMSSRPARVLDVGCGTGIASRLFAARGCEVKG